METKQRLGQFFTTNYQYILQNLSLKIMKSYTKLKDRNHIYKMYGEIFDNHRRNIDIYGFIY